MIPAMVIFAVLSAAILGLPNPLVESREAGIFRSFKINGVPALSILAHPGADHRLSHRSSPRLSSPRRRPPSSAPAARQLGWFRAGHLGVMLACAGRGLLIGVISANSRVTVLWSQLIFLPSMLLGGLMMPTSMLPASLAKVSLLLPSTHAMDAYLGLAMDQSTPLDPYLGLATLVAGGVVACALALYLFSWDRRNATSRGHPALALLALVPYALALLLAG